MMSENIRVENWCGYEIRFVEHDGSWYAVLKDICDALKLQTRDVKDRIECEHLEKLAITTAYNWTGHEVGDSHIMSTTSERVSHMLCVDEAGIYQALSRSTRLEARKFIDWISSSLVDLRKAVGLEAYEALKLTDADVQKLIADKIDISYKEPTGNLIPVAAEPTIIQNITNVTKTVDYRKVFGYAAAGCACAIVVYAGTKYIVKRVKAKKAEKELTAAQIKPKED